MKNKVDSKIETSIKINIFSLINFLMMGLIFIRKPSFFGGLTMIVLVALLWVLIRKRILKPEVPRRTYIAVASQLPIVFCVDVLIIVAIYYQKLINSFEAAPFFYLFEDMPVACWAMIFISLLFFYIALQIKWKSHVFLWLGFELLGFAVVFLYFRNITDIQFGLDRSGSMLLITYITLSVIWFAFSQIGYILNGCTTYTILGLSSYLIAVFWATIHFKKPEVALFMNDLPDKLREFSQEQLSWYWMIVIFIIFFSGIIALIDLDDQNSTNFIDVLSLQGILGFVLISKAVTYFYFPYSWITLILYLTVFLNCLKKAYSEGSDNDLLAFITRFVFICVFSLILLSKGLILSLILILLCVYLFAFKKVFYDRTNMIFWLASVLGIVSLVISLIIQYRFSMENIVIVLMVGMLGLLAVLFVCYSQSKKPKTYDERIRFFILITVSGLLLIPLWRAGGDITIRSSQENNTVDIKIKARGKENKLVNSYYYWTDIKMDKVNPNLEESVEQSELDEPVSAEEIENSKVPIEDDGSSIPIISECLTIVTIDKYGLKTIKKHWFPYAFNDLEGFM